ncbi:MAG: hypothetical protein ABSF65_11575 [Candidatus Bathyarchaeia archaeon]
MEGKKSINSASFKRCMLKVATGSDSISNYLVYGLSVSSNSVQAYVDHANTYIGSLVPS